MANRAKEGKLSPFLRDRRMNAAKKYVSGRVLDVGCGVGVIASLVDADNYIGVDVDQVTINDAKKSYPNHVFQTEMPEDNEKFDTITSLAVIEHIHEPVKHLESLANHLTPDGKIVCTTPHLRWIGYIRSGPKSGFSAAMQVMSMKIFSISKKSIF